MTFEQIEELKNARDFLAFFYSEVYDFLGPAAGDAYFSINERWVEKGNEIPDGYKGDE